MTTAIIVAGGSGSRIGGQTPKQFLEIGGKPIIIYCMETFNHHKEIDSIIAVCQPEYMEFLHRQAKEHGIFKLQKITEAGVTRRESVLNGLKAVNGVTVTVLIHDAARPLVSEKIISDNIAAVALYGAVVTAIPAVDTMFTSQDGLYAGQPLARSGLYSAQTPQSFRLDIIMAAHLSTDGTDATDDCQLVLAIGHKVAIVQGSEMNFKVTTSIDLDRLKAIKMHSTGVEPAAFRNV